MIKQGLDAMALTSALVAGHLKMPTKRKSKPANRNRQAKASRKKNRGK